MNEATLKNRSCLVEREKKLKQKRKEFFSVAESFFVELDGGENILQVNYLPK